MRLTHSETRLEEDFLMLAELDDGVDLLLADLVWLRVIGLWKEKAKKVMHLIQNKINILKIKGFRPHKLNHSSTPAPTCTIFHDLFN